MTNTLRIIMEEIESLMRDICEHYEEHQKRFTAYRKCIMN